MDMDVQYGGRAGRTVGDVIEIVDSDSDEQDNEPAVAALAGDVFLDARRGRVV